MLHLPVIDIPGAVLEFVNGVLLVVYLGLFLFLAAYLGRRVFATGRLEFRVLLHPEIKLAWALTMIGLGNAIGRAPVWYLRHLMDHGVPLNGIWTPPFDVIVTFGAVLCTWGGICAMRALSRREWSWMIVLAGAIAFAIAAI